MMPRPVRRHARLCHDSSDNGVHTLPCLARGREDTPEPEASQALQERRSSDHLFVQTGAGSCQLFFVVWAMKEVELLHIRAVTCRTLSVAGFMFLQCQHDQRLFP